MYKITAKYFIFVSIIICYAFANNLNEIGTYEDNEIENLKQLSFLNPGKWWHFQKITWEKKCKNNLLK
jgi:hypothetical protein